MVYHDAIREGVISCWPQDAEPPLRQSITPPRPSGTVTIPETRPHHPWCWEQPDIVTMPPGKSGRSILNLSAATLPRGGHPECPPTN